MPISEEAVTYLETNPLTADAVDIPEDTFVARIKESKSLPENVQKTLRDEKTSELIRKATITNHRLSLDHGRKLAGVVRDVLMGNESAGSLTTLIQQRLDVLPPVAQDIARTITQNLITPNYFQIAQVYEKRHPTSPPGLRGAGRLRGADAESSTPVPPPVAPPRVVDLRNGPIPSRLPPPAAPLAAPPPPRPQPPKPEPPPPKTGPSADDLLDNLGKRPAPPPFVPPPGGGTHGPLPDKSL